MPEGTSQWRGVRGTDPNQSCMKGAYPKARSKTISKPTASQATRLVKISPGRGLDAHRKRLLNS